MKTSLLVFLLVLGARGLHAARPVTNEDIRDAILSVVHMIRSTEDKLERHEYRERALGDQLKKALATIDKRQRLLDPVKGTLSRLDERLATVETILIQKDERERIQMQKTFDMVEQIHRSLPQLFETLKNDIILSFPKDEAKASQPPPDSPSKRDLEKLQKEIEGKIQNASNEAVKNLGQQLSKLQEETNKVKEDTTQHIEEVKKHINNSEQVLEKYENKLAEYNNRVDLLPSNPKLKDEAQTSVLQALELQKTNIEQILSDVKAISGKLPKIADDANVESIRNETLQSVQELKEALSQQPPAIAALLDNKIKEMRNASEQNREDIHKSIEEIGDMTEILTENIGNSFKQLREEIKSLDTLKQVMMQTADGVLDTKRRVEYSVHQVVAEVGNLIKGHTKDVNKTLNDRFDNFEFSILDEENGALINISSNIASEIDQVWRQIGIMHQQMSASTDSLNKLQNVTDSYVNGSLNTMEAMGGKVGQLTKRMMEVDDNLNYLLGRLSLVTQEFNMIKSGLGEALDEIKDSFHTVQEKMKDQNKQISNEISAHDNKISG